MAKYHIVIAGEDYEEFLFLEETIHKADFASEIHWVKDGESLIEYLHVHPKVTAVILDLFMPRMDGLETLDKIRSKPQFDDLPVIVLTGPFRVQRDLSGINLFIAKPCSSSEYDTFSRTFEKTMIPTLSYGE